ncbi:hypothetical protein ABZ990_04730 [Streptomyces sp. NPDC046203]|uniref:hypothetical protein n=1 Tax=Streptomyces sp. NPDC046203 TaxID=3154602 RepID=UPI0033DBE1D2
MEHRIRLAGPAEAAPELACLRVIARLPSHWSVEILECGTGYAILGLRTRVPAEEAVARIDEAIAVLPLLGWRRD